MLTPLRYSRTHIHRVLLYVPGRLKQRRWTARKNKVNTRSTGKPQPLRNLSHIQKSQCVSSETVTEISRTRTEGLLNSKQKTENQKLKLEKVPVHVSLVQTDRQSNSHTNKSGIKSLIFPFFAAQNITKHSPTTFLLLATADHCYKHRLAVVDQWLSSAVNVSRNKMTLAYHIKEEVEGRPKNGSALEILENQQPPHLPQ